MITYINGKNNSSHFNNSHSFSLSLSIYLSYRLSLFVSLSLLQLFSLPLSIILSCLYLHFLSQSFSLFHPLTNFLYACIALSQFLILSFTSLFSESFWWRIVWLMCIILIICPSVYLSGYKGHKCTYILKCQFIKYCLW